MTDRPKRPTYHTSAHAATERELEWREYADDADAYITAIEQEQDEAVEIIKGLLPGYGADLSVTVEQRIIDIMRNTDAATEFLTRIEGGTND